MAVDTDTQQWASREELQALTAAQDQVREQQYADRERIARLEVQLGESDKRLATKADLEAAIGAVRSDVETVKGDVRSDIRVLRLWLFVGVLVLAILDDINMIDVLLQLRRLGGG